MLPPDVGPIAWERLASLSDILPAMTYKAFISYSHAADNKLAPALQSALHRFAKPFYRLRAVRVFRDKTNLNLTPKLWPLIQSALAQSEYFLLMASPDAAQSQWVHAEIEEWLALHAGSGERLLLVLTGGDMEWPDHGQDFDWEQTNALPTLLKGVFQSEPLYADLRWARTATDLSLRNPQFLDEVATLAATLHGTSKDVMIGNDVRQHRVFKMVTAATIVLLLALTTAAIGTAIYAVRARNTATSRELAASAVSQLPSDPELSTLLAATAYDGTPTTEAEDALRHSLLRSRARATFRYLSWFQDLAYSPEGKWLILVTDRAEVIEPVTWRKLLTLERPTRSSITRGVSVSHDGTKVLTISYDIDDKGSTVRLWNAATWQLASEFQVAKGDELAMAALSPDGRLVATWSTIVTTPRVWDVARGESVALGGESRVADLQFTPDSKSVLTVGDGHARLWDAATGGMMSEAECPFTLFEGVSFSPDGRYTALPCAKGTSRASDTVAVLDVATARTIAELSGHQRYVTGAVFSPNGKWLVTTSADHTARVWEIGTWRTTTVLQGHTGALKGAAFSADGGVLVTSSHDGTARVWEPGAWRTLAVLQGHTRPLIDQAVSPDGVYVVTTATDSTARIWEVTTGAGVTEIEGFGDNGGGGAVPRAYSPDGNIVITRTVAGVASAWEPKTGRQVAELGRANFLAFSPDGKRLFTTGIAYGVDMWDARTWQKIGELRGHTHDVLSIAFSPDGKWIVTAGGYDDTARVWDASSGRGVAVLTGHSWRVVRALFSPDGKWIGTASYDKTARVWEVGTWRQVAELRGHGEEVWTVAFSPDTRRIVTSSYDGTARLWEIGSWRAVAVLNGHKGWVTHALFSPDGTHVLTAGWDRTARLWDTATGKAVAVMEGHTATVNDATFSPDGRLIATAGDTTVRLWDARSGRLLAVLSVVASGLDARNAQRTADVVTFSPDCRSLLAASSEGMTRIYAWEMFAPAEELRALARTRVTRELTADERQRYLHETP